MLSEKISSILKAFTKKDRRALAQTITLMESTNQLDQILANSLLEQLPISPKPTIRLAVSGSPGVGKSTLINALSKKLIKKDLKVAILAIDPSSLITSGSILADKTRMGDLLLEDNVYIRPSPSHGSLGGINRASKDVIFVLESFGFDVIIVETVGVGQSEALAYSLVDHFMVMMQPGAGDQLQAMKKGVLERADFIIVGKYDGKYKNLASKACNFLSSAFSKNNVSIHLLSSLDDYGVIELLESINHKHKHLLTSSNLAGQRKERQAYFLQWAFEQALLERCLRQAKVKHCLDDLVDKLEPSAPLGPKLDEYLSKALADR